MLVVWEELCWHRTWRKTLNRKYKGMYVSWPSTVIYSDLTSAWIPLSLHWTLWELRLAQAIFKVPSWGQCLAEYEAIYCLDSIPNTSGLHFPPSGMAQNVQESRGFIQENSGNHKGYYISSSSHSRVPLHPIKRFKSTVYQLWPWVRLWQ